MGRLHFFESLEREIDFKKEYIKLEEMCAEQYGNSLYRSGISINSWISNKFRFWNKRSNYASFEELRDHLGFSINDDMGYVAIPKIDINSYFLFCEMLLNVIIGLQEHNEPALDDVITALFETIKATAEKAGMEVRTVDDEYMIVEKNAVAIEVADKVPVLADVIIEYNHYLLEGNIDRKREILKQIADALEPKRAELSGINKRNTSDFFHMVNTMNIRHNNCDQNDPSKYNAKFDALSDYEKEGWYDLIYEQGLMLFVLLEQQVRNKKIDAFK